MDSKNRDSTPYDLKKHGAPVSNFAACTEIQM